MFLPKIRLAHFLLAEYPDGYPAGWYLVSLLQEKSLVQVGVCQSFGLRSEDIFHVVFSVRCAVLLYFLGLGLNLLFLVSSEKDREKDDCIY